jgi:hypothetical protein
MSRVIGFEGVEPFVLKMGPPVAYCSLECGNKKGYSGYREVYESEIEALKERGATLRCALCNKSLVDNLPVVA